MSRKLSSKALIKLELGAYVYCKIAEQKIRYPHAISVNGPSFKIVD